jgi:histone H3/H4
MLIALTRSSFDRYVRRGGNKDRKQKDVLEERQEVRTASGELDF